MNQRFTRLCALAACTLVLTAGCGGPSDAEKRAAEARRHDRAVAAQQKADEAAKVAAEKDAKQAAYTECSTNIKPLRDALQQVASRLDVGLNYASYGDRLGDVRVAYDSVIPKLKTAECLNVGIPLENALNLYNGVLTSWGACIDDYNCDFSKGETNAKAQAAWVKADAALKKSDTRLSNMAP